MKSLLYVAHRAPYPPDKGEKIRAYHELRQLAPHFDITLAALVHGDSAIATRQVLGRCCREVLLIPSAPLAAAAGASLSLLGGRSASEGYFASRRLRELIVRHAPIGGFDLAFGYCSSVLPYLDLAGRAPRVLDLVDVDSEKWRQYADAAAWPRKALYRVESRRVGRLEKRALESCHSVFVTSPAEAALLGPPADNLIPCGNGVDCEYFQPAPDAGHGAPTLVFTGTMSYWPNVEGICWFAREVWPLARRRWPKAELIIVGRDPAPAVTRLAGGGITVTGAVSDVRPFLSKASIAICPLRTARGVQNKVLEAMAAGKAVAASPRALEGLNVRVGVEALSADGARQWLELIGRLLDEPGLAAQVGAAARRAAVERFSWSAALEPMVRRCLQAGEINAFEKGRIGCR